MKTPFKITVQPVTWLTPCQAYKDEQARGLFGFHNTDKCPDCKLESGGFELWGENGYRQGGCENTEPDTLARIKTAYTRNNSPVELIISDSGYTYLRA